MIVFDVYSVIFQYGYLLCIGLKNTIFIWIISALISLMAGSVWGILREERICGKFIGYIFDFFAYFLISIPLYIQLLISTFIISPFFGIYNVMVIGIITLGVCSAAYTSQMIKVSFDSIPKNQWSLARNMGYGKKIILLDIVFPQILTKLVPLFVNECDLILKSVSLLSAIGVLDITRCSLNIINISFNPVPVYIILLFIHIFCSFAFRFFAKIFIDGIYYTKRLEEK